MEIDNLVKKSNKFRGTIYSILTLLLLYSAFTIISSAANSVTMPEENDDCLMCHDDKDLKGKKKGKNVSVYVNPQNQLNSVHAGAKCVDCHTDLIGVETPHDDDLKPATCGKCHAKEQDDYNVSFHGKANKKGDPLAPTCQLCHGSHSIVPARSDKSPVTPLKIPFLCGKCHQEGTPVQAMRNIPQSHILENYTESIHGEGLFKKGLTVTATCVSCHSPHLILPHTDKRSSISRGNIAKTCTQCHSRIEEVHQKIIAGERWEKEEHVLPACVDCHQPHKVRKAFYDVGLAKKECLNCHQKEGIKASSDGRSLHVDVAKMNSSVHKDLACSKCHTEVSPSKIRSCETIKTKVDCGSCHDKVKDNFVKSIHGKLEMNDDPDSPSCVTCHGNHDVLPKTDPASRIFTVNIPKLCSKCHRDGHKAAIRMEKEGHGVDHIIEDYTESVHGRGLTQGGLTVTANCADCHTAHLENNHTNPVSSTHKDNIAKTCGKCHWGIQEKFNKSIHSPNVSNSKEELPACNSCHVAHSVTDPTKDEFRFSIMATCGKCHDKISNSYFDTYHGKASLLGSSKSAKCHDCHSAHEILPVSDLNSTLSRKNIVKTCSTCHPKANVGFTRYLTHATHHEPDKFPLLFFTFWGMTGLLLGTFLISWIHTLLWLPMSLKMRREAKAMKLAQGHSGKRVMRFNRLSRILHVLMVLSFLTLASTGMMLKFSFAAWAQFTVKLLGGVEIAGFIHRFAAVVLFGVFFGHLYDLIFVKRKEFKSWKDMLFGHSTMIPNKKDLQDAIGSIKWFLGKGPRPDYGRWTYWEKFDYFAVFWGIFVIGSTGLILWFPHLFTKIVPGEFINIATIIHSDEALLAAGFIFTVHFFNTHFRPEKFPMDTVIFSGSYDLEEFKMDRPEEYRRLEEEGKIEELLVHPPDKTLKRVIKFFGWSALIVGLLLVVLIIVSILGATL